MDISKVHELDLHLTLQDQFSDPEDLDIVSGIAIKKDDLQAFVRDFEELARRYGGATFEDLLDNDTNDDSLDASIVRFDEDQMSELIKTAEKILKRGF